MQPAGSCRSGRIRISRESTWTDFRILDPFCHGNALEAQRILTAAGIPVAARFSDSDLDEIHHVSAYTVQTNPDLASGYGQSIGSFLGLEETEQALRTMEKQYDNVNLDTFEEEKVAAESAIGTSCEKFLMRHDPPVVACSQASPMPILPAGC